MPTLKEITSDIEIRFINGLKGSNVNHSYRLSQIEFDVKLTWSKVVKTRLFDGTLNLIDVSQTIGCIPLECKSMIDCCGVTGVGDNVLKFTFPTLLSTVGEKSIRYAGIPNYGDSIKILNSASWKFESYRRKAYVKPYIWLQNNNTGWLFNPPTTNIKTLTMTAVFDDPTKVFEYTCCAQQTGFPSPSDITKEVIDILVKQYTDEYRRMQIPVQINNGTSII